MATWRCAIVERGTGVASAEYLPGTRLVRAFNAINAGPLAREAFRKPERIGIPLAADDAAAMKIAAQLVSRTPASIRCPSANFLALANSTTAHRSTCAA